MLSKQKNGHILGTLSEKFVDDSDLRYSRNNTFQGELKDVLTI